MAKHFEDIWNESEEISLAIFEKMESMEVAKEAASILSNMSKSEYKDPLGEVLFRLCYLYNKNRLNSYTSLREKLNEAKIDLYDPW